MQGHGVWGSRRTAAGIVSSLLVLSVLILLPLSAGAVVRRVPVPAPSAPAAPRASASAPVFAYGPAAPTGLVVTSGDMADTLRWNAAPRSARISAYRVERAMSASGPWTIVARRQSRSALTVRVPRPGAYLYRVRAIDRKGAVGPPCEPIANTSVSLTRAMTPLGGVVRASNGSVTVVFPRGAVSSTSRFTVTDATDAATPPTLIRVTGAFDFASSAPLRKPVRVTVPYRVPVRHFQVAATVARGIDWLCFDEATRAWVPVPTSIDTVAGTLSADMPHFSHWTGAYQYPHGTSPSKVSYCSGVCHDLVAAPGSPVVVASTDSQVCLNCHGNPLATGAPLESVGHNIQAEFYFCSGQSLPVGGSRHPVRAPGAATGLKCTSCHDPHKDPALAPKLLRSYDAVTGRAVSSANATVPPAAAFCGSCHGTVRTSRAVDAQVPGYWARSGGGRIDFSRFAGSAHERAMRPAGMAYGCSGCHKPHASGDNPMLMPAGAIDWTHDTSTQQGMSRASCYGCHSGTSRRTWNGRDVKAEFARTSHHPVVAETPDATAATSTVTVLEQSTYAEFNALGPTAFSQTTLDPDGTIRTADDSWLQPYDAKDLLFAASIGALTLWQCDTASAEPNPWNTMGYTPPNHTYTGGGHGAWAWRGKIYLPLTSATEIYTPADGTSIGSWRSIGAAPGYLGYGGSGDLAIDDAHGVAYHTYRQSHLAISRLDRATDTWTGGAIVLPSAPFPAAGIGLGASIAYSPSTDQLFVVNRNKTSGDGRIYAIASPSTVSGVAAVRDTGVTIAAGATNWSGESGMTCATIGGVDYLFALGGGSGSLRVVGDLASATPTFRDTGQVIGTNNAQLTWDGGRYLYNSQGTNALRIEIPANPMTDAWGAWTALPAPPGYGPFALAVARAQAPSRTEYGYKTVGTVSAEIAAPDGAQTWGDLTWSTSVPASSAVSVTVQRPSGTGWVDLPGYVNMSAGTADLSGVSAAANPRLRVVARLTTENQHVTPRLLSWRATVNKARPVHRDQVLVPEVAFAATAPTPTVDTTRAFGATLSVPTLPQSTVYNPVPDRLLLYLTETINGEILQYDVSDNVWNGYGFDPNDYSIAYSQNNQPASFAAGGYVYTIRPSNGAFPTAASYVSLQTGPDKTPQLKGPVPGYVDAKGTDASYDPSWGFAYVSRGAADNGRIDVYSVSAGTMTPWASLRVLDPATGTALLTGEYSSISYVPYPVDKLFIVNRAGGSGNGRIYSVANVSWLVEFGGWPGTYSVTAVDTSAAVAPQVDQSHMTRFKMGGTDYLAAFGTPVPYGTKVAVVSNLGNTTQTVTWKDATSLALGGGAHIEWDGASGLYLNQGSWGTNIARMTIPADPVGAAWPTAGWTNLPVAPRTRSVATYRNQYTSLALTMSPVRGQPVQIYSSTSTTYSAEVTPTVGATSWGIARWVGSSRSGVTTVTVTAQGSTTLTGGTFADLPGCTDSVNGYIDLGGVSLSTYKRLRLKAVLTSNQTTETPRLESWSLWCNPGTGRYTSRAIIPDPNDTVWDSVTFLPRPLENATMTVTVQKSDLGVVWTNVTGLVGVPVGSLPLSMGGLSTASAPYLRVVVDYATAIGQRLASLDQVTVTSAHPESRPIGAMTCASCHNVHNVGGGPTGAWDAGRVSDPQNTRVRSTDVTSTVSGFCLRCHTSIIVRKSATASSLVLWDVLFSEQTDRPFFVGFDKADPLFSATTSAHFTTAGTRAYCETCHDPHGSDNEHLTAWTRPSTFTSGLAGVRDNSAAAAFEERLCLQCHGNGTVGRKAPGAPDVATPLSGSVAHPSRSVGGVHSDTESTATLGGTNRHAECVDCHDPHTARSGVHVTGSAAAGGALYGVVGIEPRWGSQQWVGAASFGTHRIRSTPRDPESYVCFKCHSSAVAMPATGPSGSAYTDLTRDFNPNNMSYHNVLGLPIGAKTTFTDGVSTYSWPWRGGFKAGWTKDSGVTCTGCHTNEAAGGARGPHGSSAKYMLDGNWSLDFKNAYFVAGAPLRTNDPKLICNKCHDFATSANLAHWPDSSYLKPAHQNKTCSNCHIAIPHGWKRPRLIAYTTDPAPYAATPGGLMAVSKNAGARWDFADCQAGCGAGFFGTHATTVIASPWD